MTADQAALATVGMFYDVLPGREAEFEGKFARVVQAMTEQEGHRSTVLYRRVDRPRSYAILSEWDSSAAFQAFIGSDTFRAVTDWGKAGILESRPRHRVFADRT